MPRRGIATFYFIASGRYTSEFLDLCEVVFHHVSPFVDLGIVVALHRSVCLGRNDSRGTSRVEVLQQPIRVKCLVCEQRIKCDIFDQGCNTFHVVSLAWQQKEAYEIAKGINQSHDLGCQPATETSYGMRLSPLLRQTPFGEHGRLSRQ